MKKTLLTIALALVAALGASAQAFHKSPAAMPKAGNEAAKAPQKAPNGTIEWGYYSGDFGNLAGIGTGSAGTLKAAYKVSGTGAFAGIKIHGVNLPVKPTKNTGDIVVWAANNRDGARLATKTVAGGTLSTGYNEVLFDTPVDVPAAGLFVGYDITVKAAETDADGYPILMDNNPTSGDTGWLYAGGWQDYSSQFGSLGMRVFISGLNQNDYDATFAGYSPATVTPGATVNMQVVVNSDGGKDVSDIDYKVIIGGQAQTGHAAFATSIPAGLMNKGTTTISFTAPDSTAAHTAQLSIEKVNGQANSSAATQLAASFNVVTRVVPRHTVVEEFTGTGCGFCPRGWVGMETLKKTRPDFIGIAIHQYGGTSDPMYYKNYNLPFSGAPNCMVDRKSGEIDPYYGTGNELGILDDFDYYHSLIPDAGITATAKFQADNAKVEVNGELEYLLNGGKYSIAYVLTADSLTGTSSVWKQSNYYYQYPQSQFSNPDMKQFCAGGEKGQSKVFLTFNDVLIGSSYNDKGVNLAPAIAGQSVAGQKAQTSYTIAMPTTAMLTQAVKRDKVYAIALAVAADGTIANAVRVPVETNDCDAYFTSCGYATAKAGESASLPVTIANYGNSPINNFDYAFVAGKDTIRGHVVPEQPIAAHNSNCPASITVVLPETEKGKLFSGTLSIEKVNGENNSAKSQTATANIKVIAETAPRTTVVEQFVATDCAEAPRAYAAMEAIKAAKPECIRLSVHKGATTDPMYIANYAKVFTELPSCVIDRTSGEIDPYCGTDGTAMGVLADIDRCNAMPAEGSVEITRAQFDKTNAKVEIDINANFLLAGEKYGITYVLTADSLAGTADTWMQANAYADKTADDVNGDTNLLPYCQGGQYGASKVMLTYNDVVIAATYNAAGSNSGTNFSTPSVADTTIAKTVKISMPTKTAIKAAINRDNVYAVAILTATSDGAVVNAARMKVAMSEAEAAVKGIESKAGAKPAARYNMAGQRIGNGTRGLNIVKMSDGTVRKVVVK